MENIYSMSTNFSPNFIRKNIANTSLKPCIYMLAIIGICLICSFIISIIFNDLAIVPLYGIPLATISGILIHKRFEEKEENSTEISLEEKKKQITLMRYLLSSIVMCIFVYLIIAFKTSI
jgi:hypothetical protein